MSKYFLGIDTSCYTTSIAIVNAKGELILDRRKMLDVKKGARGLRQSEALFQHINNLPVLFENISYYIDVNKIKMISVSSKPRNIENSYMPVFLAGVSFGKTISAFLNIDYCEYSHQEGHIEAARWSSKTLYSDKFIAVHISGGTTEILRVKKEEKGYLIKIIGGTKDISAGQLIDRIGVMMGLNFPAGKELETLSLAGEIGKISIPVSTTDTYINFSGAETYVKKLISEKDITRYEDIALALFICISKSLEKAILNSCYQTGISEVLLVGGVASNNYIREKLCLELGEKGIKVHFGKPKFCTDNAVGTALMGKY